MTEQKKQRRGFAAMSESKRKAIASQGGRAAHAKGKRHCFSSLLARTAGSKGGKAAHARGTAHKFTSDTAKAAAKMAVQSRKAKRAACADTTTPTTFKSATPELFTNSDNVNTEVMAPPSTSTETSMRSVMPEENG